MKSMKYRFGLCALFAGLILSICMSAAASDLPSTVRIGLFYGNSAKETVTLSSDKGVYLYDTSFENLIGTVSESVSITAQSGSYMISGVGTNASEVLIASPVDGVIAVNGSKYRGAGSIL